MCFRSVEKYYSLNYLFVQNADVKHHRNKNCIARNSRRLIVFSKLDKLNENWS